MRNASPALIFDKVCFSYPTSHSPVINIEKWQIERGQHVFVSGQSGSGKSTLLNLICGTLTPNSGEITLLGESFSSRSSSQRDAFRGKHIGVVFQQFNLIPYLTVHDNIKAAAYFGNSVQKDFEAKVSYFIETLQLPKDTLARRADSLSVGQQQRVAIARSLINSPEILVVDEPTSALDSDARDRFMQLLFECVEKTQSTLLFVSHDKSLAHFFSSTIDINSLSNSVSNP